MKKILYFVLIPLLIFFTLLKIYDWLYYTHIKAKFKELRPYHGQIPVYYKGILIGKAKERNHSIDFQHTIINITLYQKDFNIPENSQIYLKKITKNKRDYDYLELIYPKEPSKTTIKNGSILNGIALVDFDDYMSNHHPDDLEMIKENLKESSENLNNALAGLSDIFALINDILEENQKNINKTTTNIESTTANLNKISQKINNSIKQENLNNTMLNIEQSSKNISDSSNNFTNTTTQLNDILPKVNASMDQIYSTTRNVNTISCGIRKTLTKRFGGIRLIFGKVIE